MDFGELFDILKVYKEAYHNVSQRKFTWNNMLIFENIMQKQ